jgi:biopolymer transport protein ExbD
MIGAVPALLLALLFVLSSCVGNHEETVGFRVSLMPPCHIVSQPRNQESSSVALELHASGSPTINGDNVHGRPWVALLREIFSTRSYKTLLLVPDQEVQMGQLLMVLDQLQKDPFLKRIILLTPKQVNDIGDRFCIMEEPA